MLVILSQAQQYMLRPAKELHFVLLWWHIPLVFGIAFVLAMLFGPDNYDGIFWFFITFTVFLIAVIVDLAYFFVF